MTKSLTDADRIRAYQLAHVPHSTLREFGEALGVSHQTIKNWLDGVYKPNVSDLQGMAKKYVGAWQCELAKNLLEARGASVPCVCLLSIGDNGPCPKHSVNEKAVAV